MRGAAASRRDRMPWIQELTQELSSILEQRRRVQVVYLQAHDTACVHAQAAYPALQKTPSSDLVKHLTSFFIAL